MIRYVRNSVPIEDIKLGNDRLLNMVKLECNFSVIQINIGNISRLN